MHLPWGYENGASNPTKVFERFSGLHHLGADEMRVNLGHGLSQP